jgi:hypothetical protein
MKPQVQTPASQKKKKKKTGCWWFTPVILTTWETKIRRISVEGQLGQIVCETLSQKYSTQKEVDGMAQVADHPPNV